MLIGIIDDGIVQDLYHIGKLKFDIEITPDLQIIQRSDHEWNYMNHATTCAAIIQKNYEKAEFASIKILDTLMEDAKSEQLITAINWCTEKKIKLINLSLGTTDYRDFEKIRQCVNEAAQKGMIIVAANSNQNVITYPAFLSNVIGVKQCERDQDNFGFRMFACPDDGIDCHASGVHELIDQEGNRGITPAANSFAAPYITAMVASILERDKSMSVREVKTLLQRHKLNQNRDQQIAYRRIDWANEAHILCFDRQSEDLIHRHTEELSLLCSEIEEIETEENCFSYVLQRVRSGKEFPRYNTIVIADKKGAKSCYDDYALLVRELNELRINLIYLKDEREVSEDIRWYQEEFRINIWHPYLQIPSNRAEKKDELEIPLIRIVDCGTGEHHVIASQLRQKFCNDGYYAISTSFSSLGVLFGSEYASSQNIQHVEGHMQELYDVYHPDVIILHYSKDEPDSENIDTRISFEVSVYLIRDRQQAKMIQVDSKSLSIFLCDCDELGCDKIHLKSCMIDQLHEVIYNALKE